MYGYSLTPFDRKKNDLYHAFRDFENDFFGGTQLQGFCTDIKDEGDKYVLEAELPGMKKEDIKLEISGDSLILSAEHKSEGEDKCGRYIRRERSYGSYQRSFDVSGIDTDRIDAEYKDGILKLELPKKAPSSNQSKRLEIR